MNRKGLKEVIRDRDGNGIKYSRNLRGIREYVRTNVIKTLGVFRIGQGEGKLMILFDNGCSYESNFASFSVLCGFVRRWRNVQGAPLRMDRGDCGICYFDSFWLQEGENGRNT